MLRSALYLLVPLLALGAGFHRLVARPGALLVDPGRSSVDHAGPPGSRGPGNDLTNVVLPRLERLRGHIARGVGISVPRWDASGFGGRPWIGNPQAGTTYPATWMAALIGTPAAAGWLTVGHLAWASIGTFLLARRVGGSRLAAALSATCFSSSPYLIAHTFEGHYPHVWAASWYPWAFWAHLGARSLRAEGLLLPPILALAFLTGHPQEWHSLAVALGIWAAADVLMALRRRRSSPSPVALVAIAAAGLLSLAMIAVELLPQVAVRRWALRDGPVGLDAFHHYELRGANLIQLLSPFALGRPHDYFGRDNYWETLLSFGLLPILLAVAGVVGPGRRAARRGWGLLALLAIVFAAGPRLGLYSLAYHAIPGLAAFRVPARSLFLASLAVAVLAGLGLDALGRRRGGGRPAALLRRVAFATLLLGGAAWAWLDGPAERKAPRPGPEAPTKAVADAPGRRVDRGEVTMRSMANVVGSGTFWAAIATACVALSPPFRGRFGAWATGATLGLGGCCELAALTAQLIVVSPPERWVERPALTGLVSGLVAGASGPSRVASQPQVVTDLIAGRRGFEMTNVNDSFQIRHAADLYTELYPYLDPVLPLPGRDRPMDGEARRFHEAAARAVLDLFSVRAVASEGGVALGGLVEEHAAADDRGAFRIQSNPGAMPRAYVVPRAIRPAEAGLPAATLATRADPRTCVVMDDDPLPDGERQPFTPARWSARDDGDVLVEVTTELPGLLVVGNAWMPGWTADLDGSPAPVMRGNHWQQVIPLPRAGPHRVRLRYEPPGYPEGRGISAVAVGLWGLGSALLLARSGSRGKGRLRPSRDASG